MDELRPDDLGEVLRDESKLLVVVHGEYGLRDVGWG